MDKFLVGIFAPSAPMIIAQTEGFFRDCGLEVAYDRVESSEAQFRNLASGRYSLVQTAFDNVASYSLNQSNALGRRFPVQACLALDGGMNLSLMASPEVAVVADLRGRTVSVDSPDTGFAFVLYSILEAAGLTRDVDYEVVLHGGVVSRMERLLAGESAATLLSNGLELVAKARGLHRLAGSQEAVSPYLGSVIAATHPWIDAHPGTITRFRAAFESATKFVLDSSNRIEVVGRIAEARHLPVDVAATVLFAELEEAGLSRSITIDANAAMNVLELRAKWGGFDKAQELAALVTANSDLFAEQ